MSAELRAQIAAELAEQLSVLPRDARERISALAREDRARSEHADLIRFLASRGPVEHDAIMRAAFEKSKDRHRWPNEATVAIWSVEKRGMGENFRSRIPLFEVTVSRFGKWMLLLAPTSDQPLLSACPQTETWEPMHPEGRVFQRDDFSDYHAVHIENHLFRVTALTLSRAECLDAFPHLAERLAPGRATFIALRLDDAVGE